MASKFFENIRIAKEEREVEDVYNKGITLYFSNSPIEHPFDCDGFISTKVNGKLLRLIIEYKFERNLKQKLDRAKVLAQVIFYLKRFEEAGQILPTVCMVGDVNECFVLHVNELHSFLDEDIDWSIAPSEASKLTAFVVKIAESSINPFVWDIDENFSFKDVADKIKDLAENVQRYVHVTEHNISVIFEYFCNNVIKDRKNVSADTLVSAFIGTISDKDNYYQHPTKKNELVTPSGRINIRGDGFSSFLSYFNIHYTPQEKNRFTEIADRLIDDEKRRKDGQFFTPTLFVDKAHRLIESVLGEDWKTKYAVWDNCWGTGNLTRDYKFSELYASSLYSTEMDIGYRYNPEATKFKFDFLKDPLSDDLFNESKLPASLIKVLKEKRPIVFLMNPPYATPSSDFGKGEASKGQGATDTAVSEEMNKIGLGNASNQLFAQFIFRVHDIIERYNLTDYAICLFCKPIFLSGTDYDIFRKKVMSHFQYRAGMLFPASEFSDCSDKWGISFSVWTNGHFNATPSFNHLLVERRDCEIVEVGRKDIYNLDEKKTLKDWIRRNLHKEKKPALQRPTLSSGVTVKLGKNCRTNICETAIGCYQNMGNNIMQNNRKVALFTSNDSSNMNGLSITKDNLLDITAAFAARKLIEGNWINDKDEYMPPNEQHPRFKEFVNDSLVYSLFHTSSNQSSLRQIEFKGKLWDITNEFIWISKEEIMALANNNGMDETYNDARVSNNRYIYQILCDRRSELSNEACNVLNKASILTRNTMKSRSLYNEDNPQYQILNWDCGYYQLKGLWETFMKSEFLEFREAFKHLSLKMQPMVYELGFLRH